MSALVSHQIRGLDAEDFGRLCSLVGCSEASSDWDPGALLCWHSSRRVRQCMVYIGMYVYIYIYIYIWYPPAPTPPLKLLAKTSMGPKSFNNAFKKLLKL